VLDAVGSDVPDWKPGMRVGVYSRSGRPDEEHGAGPMRRFRLSEVTPESAEFTAHHLNVDSSKAIRELGYRETPLPQLLSDTLAWMRTEGMLQEK